MTHLPTFAAVIGAAVPTFLLATKWLWLDRRLEAELRVRYGADRSTVWSQRVDENLVGCQLAAVALGIVIGLAPTCSASLLIGFAPARSDAWWLGFAALAATFIAAWYVLNGVQARIPRRPKEDPVLPGGFHLRRSSWMRIGINSVGTLAYLLACLIVTWTAFWSHVARYYE